MGPAEEAAPDMHWPDNDLSRDKAGTGGEDEDDEDFEDETLSERLWGLAEMFPDDVRKLTWNIVSSTCKTIKCVYNCTRSATWIFFSSSLILFAPVIFEVERANMEEVQRREQKQILLGPNAALNGGRSPA